MCCTDWKLLTYILAMGNNTIPIEVRLRPKHAQWRYRLDVLADGQRVYFDRASLKFQHFRGVLVYTPTYSLNQSEVIIMFDTGVGVEVIENEGFMSARVYLPWTYMVRFSKSGVNNSLLASFAVLRKGFARCLIRTFN